MPTDPRLVPLLPPAARRVATRRAADVGRTLLGRTLVSALVLTLVGACDRYRADPGRIGSDAEAPAMETGQAGDAEHEHAAGAYGGAISSIGGDRFHAEAVVDQQGALAVYLLGQDVTRIQEVQQQQLTAYVKPRHSSEAAVILLRADPAPGDRQGWTSRFRGQLPQDLRRQSLYITVPGLRIGDERFAVRFALAADREPAMPTRLADSQAEELYLTAGGRYTEADIEENGRTTASERYAGFRASHNFNPSRGDPICPISRTKANPQCSWIIGGETYLFCCPPCIDEFLALAKDTPDAVLAPEDYVQQP